MRPDVCDKKLKVADIRGGGGESLHGTTTTDNERRFVVDIRVHGGESVLRTTKTKQGRILRG